jgi:hypothetical protein
VDDKPLPVIEYATPASVPSKGDERAALVLGIIGAILGTLPIGVVVFRGHFFPEIFLCSYANAFGLVAGGVGWGLSRHSRPNSAHTLCAWVNTLNWASVAAFATWIIVVSR